MNGESGKLVDIKDREPNQHVIDRLKLLLSEAESGELRNLVYVTGYDDGSVTSSYVFDPRTARLGARSVLGELVLLLDDLKTNVQCSEGDSILAHWINGGG